MYNLYIWENKYNLSVFAVSIAYAGDTQTTMTVTADDISSGDVAVISISLPSDAQGKVTVSVDGKNYDANNHKRSRNSQYKWIKYMTIYSYSNL